jgi:hypothetical protein
MEDMTESEHIVAWELYTTLFNKGRICAASCGCERDPIVIIVKTLRKHEQLRSNSSQ